MKGPVSWLLGRGLLVKLKWIILYALVGDRFSGKDWMAGKQVDYRREEPDEFWFDYLADTGDSQRAAYSIARLCLSHLYLDPGDLERRLSAERTPATRRLRRGKFLFVGGDTSYHTADYRTLADRFQLPFRWAHKDLTDGHRPSRVKRSIFGIPGNHDYYDALDGFNRQFRAPAAHSEHLPADRRKGGPQLEIPGYRRVQEASYVAMSLPHGWTFLGIDAQEGKVDLRQLAFFSNVLREQAPKKLIVATPEPLVVFGRDPGRDAGIVRTLRALGLPCPFVGELPEEERTIPAGSCRLDLAGDVHHYARYGATGASPHYASVVSGIGGAFLHPSHTRVGDHAPDALYPKEDVSRDVVNREIFNPWVLLQGGNVAIIGFVVWVVLLLAVRGAPGSLGDLMGWAPGHPLLHPAIAPDQLREWPAVLRACAGFLATGTLATLAACLFYRHSHGMNRSLAAHAPPAAAATGELADPDAEDDSGDPGRSWGSYAAFLLLPLSTWLPERLAGAPEQIGPLTQSVLLCGFAALGLSIVYAAVWHGEVLATRAKKWRVMLFDDLATVVIALFGLAYTAYAFLRYGGQPVAVLGFHVVLIAVVLACSAGLVALALGVGGARHATAWKPLFFLLGMIHAALQLGLPIAWSAAGVSPAVLLYVPLFLVLNVLGYHAGKGGHRWTMLALWVLGGAAAFAVPIALGPAEPPGTLGWAWYLVPCLLLPVISFGWYLAVSLAFDGHNNEAGGAARVERFNQFIRFCVTPDGLTGYVIAVDQPKGRFDPISAHVEDVFTIRPRSARRSRAPRPAAA